MNSQNLYQRLNGVMKNVRSVFKGAQVSMGGGRGYSAVSHDDVTSLIHMPFAEAGIFVETSVTDTKITPMETKSEYNGKEQIKMSYLAEVWVEATFVNVDVPTERFSVKSYAYALDSGDKAIGKAQSMAVKYIFLKNLLLESTDEEESRDYEQKNKPVNSARTAPSTSSTGGTVSQSATGNGNVQVSSTPKQTTGGPLLDKQVEAAAPRGSFRRNAAPAAKGL